MSLICPLNESLLVIISNLERTFLIFSTIRYWASLNVCFAPQAELSGLLAVAVREMRTPLLIYMPTPPGLRAPEPGGKEVKIYGVRVRATRKPRSRLRTTV
jgi:hypothetical protein